MRGKAQISFFSPTSSERMSSSGFIFFKRSRPRLLKMNQSGASVVEYILLVVVVVSMLLTLTQLFWRPFSGFLDNYVGGYTQCLLEVGELPVLGGETDVEDLEECRARFSERVADGNRRSTSDGSTSSSSSRSARERQERERTERAAGSVGSSRSQARMSSSSRRGTETGSSGGGKTQQIELDEDGAGFYRVRGQSSAPMTMGRVRRSGEERMTINLPPEERERLGLAKPKRTPAEATIGSIKQPTKKVIVKPPPGPKKEESLDEPFSFGNLVRLLIILAILILVFILLGAFILQVRQTVRKES